MMNYREAQRVAERIEEVAGVNDKSMTLPQLMAFGAKLWPVTYEIYPDNDEDALNSLLACLDVLDETAALLWDAIRYVPHEKIKAMWAARWVDQGCPRVVLDPKYAALLMSTDAGNELADMVRPPWKAFVIEVPEGLLPCLHPKTGRETFLTKILVHSSMDQGDTPLWNLIMEAPDGVQLWRHGLETRDALILDRERIHDWTKAAFLQPIETQDERLLVLAGRLVVSACLAMSDPTNIREQKTTKGRGGNRRLNKTGPSIRTFIIGQPTTIDCRQAINDFIHAGPQARNLKVQFLVRGHWKRQAHGPANQLRKLIHVEPYWKGPEEAKILTRSIQLGLEKNG